MTNIAAILLAASLNQGVPADLLSSICFIESSNRPSVIHKDDGTQDSVGLCQLHPDTARSVGFKGNDKELLNPEVNAIYAARYLRHQLIRYNGDVKKAVSAYNSGTYTAKNSKYVTKVLHHLVMRSVDRSFGALR